MLCLRFLHGTVLHPAQDSTGVAFLPACVQPLEVFCNPGPQGGVESHAQAPHQCCRAQCSHAMNHVPCGENLDLCLQVTLVHGSAVGTATPKQPNINLLHIKSKKVDVTVVTEVLRHI